MVDKTRRALTQQLRAHWRTLALIMGAALFFIGVTLLLHTITDTPIGDLTRDPLATAELPFYVGFMSQVGLLIWSACASVTLFSALMIPDSPQNRPIKLFLVGAGLFTVFLALDDAFLLHEELFPKFGISETLVYGVYFAMLGLFLFASRKIFMHTPYIILLTALACFALSIGLDELPLEQWDINPFLLGDSFKLMGILAWCQYFVRVSLFQLRLLIQNPNVNHPQSLTRP